MTDPAAAKSSPPPHHPAPLLPPPTYAQVNGPALGLLFVALLLVALALFAFNATDATLWGAAIGYGLALLDAAVTGFFLRRAAERMEGPPERARRAGETQVLGISFIMRLIVLTLGALAIQQRLPGIVEMPAFLVTFMVLHFVAIAGWGIFFQRRAEQRREARAAAKSPCE